MILRLVVEPQATSGQEAYVALVSAQFGGQKVEIGSFSFFPPPRVGVRREFTLPIPQEVAGRLLPGQLIEILVQLVDVESRAPLKESRVAVVSATLEAASP